MLQTNLKIIRERHNLSQIKMGEILHLSQSAYQKLENGTSSLRSEHIIILIKYFGEGAKDLLKDYGIEITYDNKDMAAGKKSNSISNEVLHEILEKINDIKIRLNP